MNFLSCVDLLIYANSFVDFSNQNHDLKGVLSTRTMLYLFQTNDARYLKWQQPV